LFSKNNFWHYHAFAYYNYYVAYLTKPKITQEEKQRLSDKLLLSILAIPQVTLEKSQSKDIQEKVCTMITPSGKIPTREQLVELMISRGVLENASETVNELWNFMFLEFGVTSLNKGLHLVKSLNESNKSFQSLIEATLINKQLLSIAEVYQRIRLSSLERLINLPLEKIKRILIEAHRQKTLDFTFDESQGILVFEDQAQQTNPTEEFHQIFIDVSLLIE
jgi:translation initiation factor 3 subunit A